MFLAITTDRAAPQLYSVFDLFIHAWPNFWMVIALLLPPILVFAALPRHRTWWRLGRLLIAVALGTFAINVAAHTEIHKPVYRDCSPVGWEQEQPPDERRWSCTYRTREPRDPEHKHPWIAIYYYYGWLLIAGHTALWEFVWRMFHRRRIRAMGSDFRGRGASTIFILCFAPSVLGFAGSLLAALISLVFLPEILSAAAPFFDSMFL